MNWKKLVLLGMGAVVVLLVGLVSYGALMGESRLSFADLPSPALEASTDPEVIERGRYLVHGPGHCAQCHATYDRKKPRQMNSSPLSGGMVFEMGPVATLYARNLTPDPETGIGAISDEHLARTLRTGVMADGSLSVMMRLAASRLSDDDIVAVMSYLRSLEPVRNPVPRGRLGLVGKLLLTYMLDLEPHPADPIVHVEPSEEPSLARGEYLAEYVMLCVGCHTEWDKGSFEQTGPKAGGGLPEPSHDDKSMEFAAPNLTSHPTGRTGQMDENAFVARMQAGRHIPGSIMPWESIQLTSEADLRSVYRYLRSLPPVDNETGPSYRDKGWKPSS